MNDPRPVTRREFHSHLDELDSRFIEAAATVAESMPRLTRAFLAGDESSVDHAQAMAEDVQDRIRDVEDQGLIMLAREAPVGRDLRQLVALLRLCTDVDRSAALLRHVSETLRRFDPRDLDAQIQEVLSAIADSATAVYRSGIDAWRTRDGEAVRETQALDDDVDDLQRRLLEAAAEEGVPIEASVILGLIARYFERIADHGVALARDTSFVVTGERVTG